VNPSPIQNNAATETTQKRKAVASARYR